MTGEPLMDTLAACFFILAGMLAVDACARSSAPRDERPMGFISLIFMCLMSKKSSIADKGLAIKRFILSLLLIFFMLFISFSLLFYGIPQDAGILDFALLFSPLFIMPFYHFLYELLGVRSLSVSAMLFNFRLRGALALLLVANMIFVFLKPLTSIISLMGHFLFAYLALFGMFNLCSLARRRPSIFDPPAQENDEALEPVILRYALSILEIFYCFSLLFYTFLASLGQTLALPSQMFFALSLGLLLLITTVINKIQSIRKSWLLSFYEDKAVPLSFIFFGLMHLADSYF